MDKPAILSSIRAHRAALEAEGITHVYLFGSVQRGDAGENSDVDLFFDHDIPNLGAFAYVGLKQLAQDILPFKVDFIERSCLHPKLRPAIEAGAELVF